VLLHPLRVAAGAVVLLSREAVLLGPSDHELRVRLQPVRRTLVWCGGSDVDHGNLGCVVLESVDEAYGGDWR
jgi:hypothetical protein